MGPVTWGPQWTRLSLAFQLAQDGTWNERPSSWAVTLSRPPRPAGQQKHGLHPRPRRRSGTGFVPWLRLRSPTKLRLTCVTIPDRKGRGQPDPAYWQARGAGVADKNARRSQLVVQANHSLHGGYSAPRCP
jgi:hypothetical protein